MKCKTRFLLVLPAVIAALAVAVAPSCGGDESTDAGAGGDTAAVPDTGAPYDAGQIPDTGTPYDAGPLPDSGPADIGGTFTVDTKILALPAGTVPDVVTLSGNPVVIRSYPENKYLYVGDKAAGKVHMMFKKMAENDQTIDFPSPSDFAVNAVDGVVAVTSGNGTKLGFIDPVNGNTLSTVDIPDDTGDVKTRPLAYDQGHKEVVILNPNKGTVTVIDLSGATPVVVPEITVGSKPITFDLDRQNHKIIVVNSGDNTVSVISRPDNTVTSVPVGTNPVAVEYSITDQIAYVVNKGDNTLTKVDIKTAAATGSVPVGTSPIDIIIDQTLNMVYVVNSGDDSVTVVNVGKGTTRNVKVGKTPIALGIDTSIPMIFTVNSGDDTFSIIDYWKDYTVYTYPTKGLGATGMTVDIDTGTLYILNGTSKDISVVGGYKHKT